MHLHHCFQNCLSRGTDRVADEESNQAAVIRTYGRVHFFASSGAFVANILTTVGPPSKIVFVGVRQARVRSNPTVMGVA
ncbi:MAG: hypothetical protein HKN47_05115 [Pirellulaceae bacterium]|nr:hypothetical protein [Pirellulaceae bacterium]